MPGLSNISAYARGRNIDAAVDAAVNGATDNEKGTEKESEIAAAPPKKTSSQRINETLQMGTDAVFGVAEKIFGPASEWPTLGSRSDSGDMTQVEQVASLGNEGVSAVREGLGDESSKVSDAELKSALGSNVIAQIGKEGFPHDEVNGIQKEFEGLGMDKVAALQTYVEACSSAPGEQIHLCDHKGETVASLDSDKVLAAAGLDRSDIDQARGDKPQQAEQTAQREESKMAAAEADAGMAMSA